MNKKAPSLKPRKLPSQSRAGHTVAAILEAAAEVLEQAGIGAFNTNLVAARAGVSVGTLYQYFPNKDAIVVALCLQQQNRLLADAATALQGSDGKLALEHLIDAACRQQLSRPALARALDYEEGRPAIARELEVVKAGFYDMMNGILTRPDVPPPADLMIAAADVMSIIRALVDAAGERQESDQLQLSLRVRRAVYGYLGIS